MTPTEKKAFEQMREALKHGIREMNLSGKAKECMPLHHAITAANAVSEPQPAGPEDMAIYKSIADGYFNAVQSQSEASEVSATLAQFGKDGTKDWPEWMKAAAHTATASFQVRSKEMREFDVRGVLAAKLTCWHRMSEADSDALVALFSAHPQATEPAWRPIESAPKDGTVFLGLHGYKVREAYRVQRDDCEMWCFGGYSGDVEIAPWTKPTHWMPLPAAPEAQ